MNEDTGESVIILTHILKAQVLYTDNIKFDVKFTSTSDDGTSNATINYDAVQCKMENDTRNTAYWIVNAEDGHYTTAAETTYVKDSVPNVINSGQDWFIEEDDINRDEPLCTPPDGTENWPQALSYFACKEIRCEVRRVMDTGDFYDIDFKADGTAENLVIKQNNAVLQFNQSGIDAANIEEVTNDAVADISIKVVKGALSGIMSSALAVAALAYATF